MKLMQSTILVAAFAVPFAASAASAYTQPWSGASAEGWEANTTSSTVVHDAGVGNPAGSLAVRRDLSGVFFDIGATSGNTLATRGDFSGTPWKVSFDLQLNTGKFTDLWLRYRYQDATYNGWRHAFAGSFDTYNTWTNYAVTLDPSWSDAQAMANGWQQEAGPAVSFAQTMGNAYRTEIRIANSDGSSSALAHIDNFVQTPVPEPGTYALMACGLAVVSWLGRRRSAAG